MSSARRHYSKKPVLFKDLPQDQQKEILDAFTTFDSDKSQTIDRHELRVAFKALGFELSKDEAYSIMEANNATNQGLSKEQFCQACAERIVLRSPDEEVTKSFLLFDSDADRKIDLKDLQKVCHATGIHFDEPVLRKMIEAYAPEGCDYITVREFREIIRPTNSVFN